MKFNLIASPSNNITLEQFFDLLQQYYGLELEKIPYKEWRKKWENDKTNFLYPLTSLFKDNMHNGLSTVELYQHTYVWDNRNVLNFIQDSDIKEPVFTKEVLDTYLQHLKIEC